MAWQSVIQHGSSFANRARRLLLLALSVFGLALVVLITTVGTTAHGASGAVLAAGIAVCCLYIGVRALTSHRIDVTDSRLVVKSVLRNRSIAYTDLSHARVITYTTDRYGMAEVPQLILRLEYTSGAWLNILRVRESIPDAEVIETAADLINERIDLAQRLSSP